MTLARTNNYSYPSFPSIVDRFLNGGLMDWNHSNFADNNSTLPAVNVKESDDEYMIDVAAPGMKKDDFSINLDNGRLTISAENKEEMKDENDNYLRREFAYAHFMRTFTLPENKIDGEKIKAKYEDGILHIHLPKREEVKPKPAREIKIS